MCPISSTVDPVPRALVRGRGRPMATHSELAVQAATFAANTGKAQLNQTASAEFLGCSVDFFAKHVKAEVRAVRKGGLTVYPVAELYRWMDDNARAIA